MNNLFSTFDPCSWFSAPLNWISIIAFVAICPPIIWVANNQPSSFLNIIIFSVRKEFKSVLLPTSNPAMTLVPISLFTFIVINNAWGLTSYTFTATSHISVAVALALPLWIGHMVFAASKTPNSIIAHLVPLSTPPVLMPFIVLIELTRRIIRPLTLSVRLAANIIAGHLLLALLAGSAPVIGYPALGGLFIGLLLLGVLECAVSIIQAYVFRILSTLYINEVNSPSLS